MFENLTHTRTCAAIRVTVRVCASADTNATVAAALIERLNCLFHFYVAATAREIERGREIEVTAEMATGSVRDRSDQESCNIT